MKKTSRTPIFVLRDTISKEATGCLVLYKEDAPVQEIKLYELPGALSELGLTVGNLIIALAGSEILQTYLDAPQLGSRKLEKALYWSTEPLSSIPLEKQTFFWHRAPSPENTVRCLVSLVETSVLNNWHSILTNCGLEKARLTTLSQLLQGSAITNFLWSTWYFWENNQGMGALSDSYIEHAPDQIIPRITVGQTSDTGSVSIQELIDSSGLTEWENFSAKESQDLFPGEFIQPRLLAVTCSACVLMFCTYFLIMGNILQNQADEIGSQAVDQYKNWFPLESNVVNVRRQLTGKLNQGSSVASADSMTSHLQTISRSLDQTVSQFQLERIRYQSSDETFQLVLIIQSMEDLSALESMMESRNYEFSIQSATRRSAGLEVGLIISPYGA